MKSNRSKHSKTQDSFSHGVHALADDAEALIEATKEIADDTVKAAREKLATTIERSQEIYFDLKKEAIQGAKYADEAVREHPYQTAAIALGVGALLGFLCGRRK